MTFLGKVLIVVQVILSVCFMAFAGAVYSTQQSWKDKATDLQNRLNTANSERDAARTELSNLENAARTALGVWNNALPQAPVAIPETGVTTAAVNHVQAQAQQVAQLTAQNQNLTNERDNLATRLAAAEKEVVDKTFLADEAQKEALFRETESKQLRARVQELNTRNAELLAEAQTLNTDLFNRDVNIRTMVGKQESLLRRVGELEQILALNSLKDDMAAYEGRTTPPPDVQGKVLATRAGEGGQSDLITISLGSDDGLREGHELMAYRTNGKAKYLGRIRIVLTTPDQSVGAIVEKAPNGQIQKDDHVASQL